DLHGQAEVLQHARGTKRFGSDFRTVFEAIEVADVDGLEGNPPLVVEASQGRELAAARELAAFERRVGQALATPGLLALEAAARVGAVAAGIAAADALARPHRALRRLEVMCTDAHSEPSLTSTR